MSLYRKIVGKAGEEHALLFLQKNGYTMREHNWRSPLGEIDLIVEKDGFIVFVEVKTRLRSDFGAAAEAVIRKKQKKIARTAAAYIKKHSLYNRNFRYDVLSIMPEGIEHIENAFMVDGFTL